MSTTADDATVSEAEAEAIAALDGDIVEMRNSQAPGDPLIIFDKTQSEAWLQSDYTVEVGNHVE